MKEQIMAQVVSVVFGSDAVSPPWGNSVNERTYDYHYANDDAEVGDKCVVISPSSSHTIVVIRKVRTAEESDVMLKPVHSLISLKEEREEAANEIKRKAAQQQLDALLKKQIALDKYAALRGNPEADKLIAELEKLGK
jgi:nucleotide-binding universal stress UspA family protein